MARFVPEDAFAVDPGGVVAQGHRQGPRQRVEAAIGAFGQQVQQLAQFVAPGGCLPEQGEGIGQGPPAVAGAAQLGGEHQPLAPLAFAEPHRIGG